MENLPIRLDLSDSFITNERRQTHSVSELWKEVGCEVSEAEQVGAKGSKRRTEEHPNLIEEGKIPILERDQTALDVGAGLFTRMKRKKTGLVSTDKRGCTRTHSMFFSQSRRN